MRGFFIEFTCLILIGAVLRFGIDYFIEGYDYSLALDGDKGIIALFWQEYTDFLLRSKKFKVQLTADTMEFKKLFGGKFPLIRYDYLDFFVESVRMELENSPNPFKRPAEMVVWKKPL